MTQIVGTVFDGSTAATSHTVTVPSGVTTAMTGLFVVGTGSSDATTITLSRSGSTFVKLDERNAANTRVAVFTGTTLAAGNSITVGLSSSQAITVAHYYQDDYTFTGGSLSAAIRSASSTSTTSGSVTPTAAQKVIAVGVERTTTATTVSSATSSGGESVTQISYGEGTGAAQASCYIGEFAASAAAARTATITYSNSSANGYAALILTSGSGGGGGGGQGPGGSYTSPGQAHNIGKAGGKNHFNLGVGKRSGHVDITENAIEAGYVLTSSSGDAQYYLNADSTAVRMEVPLDGGRTSANTSYPRVEYRELNAGGSGDSDTTKAAWSGASGDHWMTGWSRVVKVPPEKPEVVLAQIHGGSDDTAKIKWRGTGSNAAVVATYGDDDYATIASGLSVGTEYQWKIQALNGSIRFYWQNMSSPAVLISDAPLVDSATQYFKAGAYSQSNQTTDSVSDGPCIVELRDLVAWHTGYPPPTTGTGVPTVNAGIDTTITVGATFGRSATEVANGSTITSRAWTIQSGPGAGSTPIDTDANLAWTPTATGTYVLRYSAVNATGTGFDDVTVTVQAEDEPPPDPPPGGGGTVYLLQYPDGTPYPPIGAGSTTVNVSTSAALTSALSAASAGQKIVLANGTYSGDFTISGKTGTASNGISVEAATTGGAVFASGSTFTITTCQHVTVKGLSFPFEAVGELLQVRGNAKWVRVTRCTFGPSGAPSGNTESGNFVYVGDDTTLFRIDHCEFRNKGFRGNAVRVYGNFTSYKGCTYGRIDHNIFRSIKPSVTNDKEPIRYGVSTMSRTVANAVIERNHFSDCLCEPELTSVKMARIRVSGNTYYRCAGGPVIRHGTDSIMSDNYVIDGNNTSYTEADSDVIGSGGFRFYDSGHDILHNYCDGLSAPGNYQRALLLDTGDAEGSSTALQNHWRVINAKVDRNVIVNCLTGIVVGDNYSSAPTGCEVTNNVTAGISSGTPPITYVGGITLLSSTVSGNVHYATPAAGGFAQDVDGIWRKAGFGPRMTYLKQADAGPTGDVGDTDGTGTPLGGSTGGGGGGGGGGGAVFPMDRLSARWALNTPEPSPWKAGSWNVYKDGGPIVFDGDNPPGPPDNPDLDTFVRDTNAQRTFKLTSAKDAIIMSVDYNGATTPNSNNPRMELREMNKDGLNEAVWNTNTGEHKCIITTRVDRLDGNHLVIGQVHGASDDVTVFRVEGTTLWASHGDTAHGANLGTVTLGQKIRIAFRTTGGVTQHYYDNNADANGATSIFDASFLKHSYSASDAGCYFKAGAYLQKQGSSGSWCQVTLFDVNIIHTGTSTALNGDDATEDRITGGGEGGGSGTTVPVVNAGGGATILAGQVFTRTGTETGAGITARRWSIEAGTGQGTTLSTTASVSWTPAAVGSYVLRYAATNSAGTGTNDATITVTTGTGGSTTPPPFVAVIGDSGESAAVEAPPPAGILTGDAQATVILSAGSETIVDPIPAGWTLWDTAAVMSPVGDPGGPCTAWVYTSTTATGTAVWTKSGTRKWHAVRLAWRGQAALGPHAATAETSASTSHATPAVTPVRANSRVIGIVCADRVNSLAGPFTPPSTWTERYDETVTIGTENLSITVADVVAGASSTTGTFASAVADEAAVFALILDGPISDQVIIGAGIPDRRGIGVGTVSIAGPTQTVNGVGIPARRAFGRGTASTAPPVQTIYGRGIPPR